MGALLGCWSAAPHAAAMPPSHHLGLSSRASGSDMRCRTSPRLTKQAARDAYTAANRPCAAIHLSGRMPACLDS